MMSVLRVTDAENNVTVMVVDRGLSLGVGNADRHPAEDGWWWLARLKIDNRHQGHGLGTLVLYKLLEVLSKKDIKGLIVAPGGYGSDEDRLFKFYKARGFVDGTRGELRWFKKTDPVLRDKEEEQRIISSLLREE